MNRTSLNGMMIAGLVLAAIGGIGLAVPYFTTSRTQEVARLGDLKLQTTENTSHAIPPLAAAGVLALGVVLLGAGAFRRG